MQKMESPETKIAKAAVGAIQNIAMKGALIRDIILEAGIMEKLSDLLQKSEPNPKIVGLTYVIINQVKPIPKTKYLKKAIESLSLVLIRNQSVDILKRTGWTLLAIIASSAEHIPAFIAVEESQTSLLVRLTELSNHVSYQVAQPALKILIELVSGSNEQQL